MKNFKFKKDSHPPKNPDILVKGYLELCLRSWSPFHTLGVKSFLNPNLSEGLFLCMYICLYVAFNNLKSITYISKDNLLVIVS